LFDHFAVLASRIVSAGVIDQAGMLTLALQLMASANAQAGFLEQLIAAGAYTDCAIALHRLVLPHSGFELGRTHSGSAFAGSWHHGDAQIASTRAATPALALLRATATEMAKSWRSEQRARCPTCNGRGWYVTEKNRKEICRHASRLRC
jgi:hypothetical protein